MSLVAVSELPSVCFRPFKQPGNWKVMNFDHFIVRGHDCCSEMLILKLRELMGRDGQSCRLSIILPYPSCCCWVTFLKSWTLSLAVQSLTIRDLSFQSENVVNNYKGCPALRSLCPRNKELCRCVVPLSRSISNEGVLRCSNKAEQSILTKDTLYCAHYSEY